MRRDLLVDFFVVDALAEDFFLVAMLQPQENLFVCLRPFTLEAIRNDQQAAKDR